MGGDPREIARHVNDPEGVLEEQRPNSRSARRIRFTSVEDVARLTDIVEAVNGAQVSAWHDRAGGHTQNGVAAMADKSSKGSAKAAAPTLLAGGNPQIAKADGDAPVQAYIEAMPGWKGDIGRQLDALIVRTVPGVRKAVRWNSPLFGIDGQGWFLGVHTFTNYVKVTFFRGTSLRPVPPVESKDESTRYFHIHEDDQLDEAQLVAWVKQASELPGWGRT
jgi:hypothetical protein